MDNNFFNKKIIFLLVIFLFLLLAGFAPFPPMPPLLYNFQWLFPIVVIAICIFLGKNSLFIDSKKQEKEYLTEAINSITRKIDKIEKKVNELEKKLRKGE